MTDRLWLAYGLIALAAFALIALVAVTSRRKRRSRRQWVRINPHIEPRLAADIDPPAGL